MRTLIKLLELLGLLAGFRIWNLYLLKVGIKKFSKQDSDLLAIFGRLARSERKGFLECSVKINGLKANLLLRKCSSDFSVFRQVFLQLEYHPLINFITSNKFEQRPIKTIFDAGANIGLTSIFFHANFPTAKIIALEPEAKNYEIMSENLRRNCGVNVIALQGALWSKASWLRVDKSFRDGLQWSFCMKETSEKKNSIKGQTVDDLMREYSMAQIDILKIDVEGGETEIFKNELTTDDFLSRTRFIAIETHDEIASAPLVEEALRRNQFIMFRSGETLFGANMRFNAIQD